MRAALERKLNRVWYGGQKPGPLLRALEPVYRGLSALARRRGRRNVAQDLADKPIVVVGNLTAGGAGKTPLVIRLCQLATGCGLRVGVVSRGYGRAGRKPAWVAPTSPLETSGDEALLIAARTGVPVRVDRQRERAVRALLKRGIELVISDDGLQRTRLPRRLEICVVDQVQGFGNGRLLPAGPLRESPTRLESMDYVVEHWPAAPHAGLASRYHMVLQAGPLTRLDGSETMAVAQAAGCSEPVFAVAGIARPERFFATLAGLGIQASCHAFADHHQFQGSDFAAFPDGSLILMTEKDAVKCRQLKLANAWCLPVDAVLSEELETALRREFKQIVESTCD
jgi:tetraacyldisaccharide 4'-kinase